MKVIRIETIAAGIVRLRQSERFGETLLERYGILDAAPEPGAEAGFTVTENGVRLPGGHVIRLNIRPEEDDEAWRERGAWLAERFRGREAGAGVKIVDGDPCYGLRRIDPEASKSPLRIQALALALHGI